ncbi:MAG: hypothetical protein HY670_10410 [Chloroflexi bacterium]|nr:hypothetical protein [Chloroflexota bacterium]
MNSSGQSDKGNGSQGVKSIADLAKLQITLATGTIVFSGTFLKDLVKGPLPDNLRNLVIISWILFGAAILFGVLIHGRYITLVSRSDYDVGDITLVVLGVLQQVSFFAGVTFFGIFATLAVN